MAKETVTVGRQVYYYPTLEEVNNGINQKDGEPLTGTVVAVIDSETINFAGWDAKALHFAALGITFMNEEPDSHDKSRGGFACWMPYQRAQQKKDEDKKESTGDYVQKMQDAAVASEKKRVEELETYKEAGEYKPPLDQTYYDTNK